MFNKCFNAYLIFIVVTFSLNGCSVNQSDEQIANPEQNENFLILTTKTDPGQKLEIYGTVIDSLTKLPIPNTKIFMYHADANGEYNPSDPNDESTAKYSGEVTTNKNGEFVVNTIVPREYENGNKHIHLHYIMANGYKNNGGVILFDFDVNDEIRQWAINTGFGFIIQTKEINGILVGNIEIKMVAHK